MTTTQRAAPFLASACLLGLLAVPVVAQLPHVHEAIPAEQLQRAEAMLQEALGLEASGEMSHWRKAARLRTESAGLRPCADPEIFISLERAAQLYRATGNLIKAEAIMKRAALHALYVGDVEHAAEGYLALAWIAQARHMTKSVHTYLARAQDLSESPLLPDVKAKALQARIIDRVSTRGSG